MITRVVHILCLCCFSCLLLTCPAWAVPDRQILVIHSYHRGFTWTDGIDAALRNVLGSKPGFDLSSEYLDSKRWPLDKVAPAFLSLLQNKYREKLPRAIILSDNNALTFINRYSGSLFNGIPIVFCGINNFTPGLISHLEEVVTGVVERTDPGGTVALIRALQPKLKKLVIVTGTTPTAQAIKIEAQTALAGIEKQMVIVWKDGMASRDLFSYLEGLSSEDAVLLIAFNRDRDGRYYTYEQSAVLISNHSAAPVYGLWDFYLGTGVVGGHMVSSKDQGTSAGEKCLEILETGQIPPMEKDSPNTILIDYPSLIAHGLKESDLPDQAVIVNKPGTFYQDYKVVVWVVSGFVTTLVALILILAANIVRRKESDRTYRTLFESSLDAIFLLTPDLAISDCNPAAFKLFRIPSKEAFLELTPMVLSPDRQADGELSVKKAKKMVAIAMGSGRHFFEWQHMRFDGETFEASVLLSLIRMGGKSVIQATVRDISDQKKAQELLIQSEKMMSVGGLAAGMAHEINNPLAGMVQNAAVLTNRLTRPDMPANAKAAERAGLSMPALVQYMELRQIPKMASAITESGARIAAIVENMLSFARKGGPAFSTHHPAELLDKVLDLAATDFDLKKHYDFKNIAVDKFYEPDLPMVACEGSKIQQVLLNILKNGAQAMSENPDQRPPRFILRLGHEKDTDMLRIDIEDNGPGMDRQTRKRIFEPFYTTKPVGVGTGLGLSVSYFIVTDNHRGTLTVSSEPGRGATFTIRLPLNFAASP